MRVLLFAAVTLDGRITQGVRPGTTWVSEGDNAFLRQQLSACQASVMGAETYRLHRARIQSLRPIGRRRLIWSRNPHMFKADELPGSLEFSGSTPQEMVEQLRREGRERCALLGGTQTYNAFLNAGLVTDLWLTIEPRLFGTGLPLVSEQQDSAWTWKETRHLGGSTLAHHYELSP